MDLWGRGISHSKVASSKLLTESGRLNLWSLAQFRPQVIAQWRLPTQILALENQSQTTSFLNDCFLPAFCSICESFPSSVSTSVAHFISSEWARSNSAFACSCRLSSCCFSDLDARIEESRVFFECRASKVVELNRRKIRSDVRRRYSK